MPICSKCNTFYPAATNHPCSSDLDPRFKKIDMKPVNTYQTNKRPKNT